MIPAAFRSEWVKLRRPSLLLSLYGAIAGVAILITILTFALAGHHFRGGGGGRRAAVTLAQLAQPDALGKAFSDFASLLGIISLAVAGAQMASEYSVGTLRNLLIRQPRRLVLWTGKFIAVLTFSALAVLLACIVGTITAVVMAHVRGVSTSAWTSSTGLTDSLKAFGEVTLAVCGYTTLGMVVGNLLRSPGAAIAVGLVYILPFELILSATVNGSDRWLPGQLLSAVSAGGTSDISLHTAIIRAMAYMVVLAGGTAVLFVRRDVTA
ncbi:MAG TPA: ABC transporter permease [Acidimicrobiales bacterium]|nr:ABC transporter permease [Acidimicrobiales bacterium]